MLPSDSPDSLIALALQCVDDDALSRPASCDVVDWLQDLYDTSPEDTVGPPVLNPLEWDSQGETSRSFVADDTNWTAINSPTNFKPPQSLPAANSKSMGNNGMTPLKTNYDSNSSSRDSPAYFIPFSSHPPLSPVPSGGLPEAADVRTYMHTYQRACIHISVVYHSTYSSNPIQSCAIESNARRLFFSNVLTSAYRLHHLFMLAFSSTCRLPSHSDSKTHGKKAVITVMRMNRHGVHYLIKVHLVRSATQALWIRRWYRKAQMKAVCSALVREYSPTAQWVHLLLRGTHLLPLLLLLHLLLLPRLLLRMLLDHRPPKLRKPPRHSSECFLLGHLL